MPLIIETKGWQQAVPMRTDSEPHNEAFMDVDLCANSLGAVLPARWSCLSKQDAGHLRRSLF